MRLVKTKLLSRLFIVFILLQFIVSTIIITNPLTVSAAAFSSDNPLETEYIQWRAYGAVMDCFAATGINLSSSGSEQDIANSLFQTSGGGNSGDVGSVYADIVGDGNSGAIDCNTVNGNGNDADKQITAHALSQIGIDGVRNLADILREESGKSSVSRDEARSALASYMRKNQLGGKGSTGVGDLSEAARYWYWDTVYKDVCSGRFSNNASESNGTRAGGSNDNFYYYKTENGRLVEENFNYTYYGRQPGQNLEGLDNQVSTSGGSNPTCIQVARALTESRRDFFITRMNEAGVTPEGSEGGDASDPENSCESNSGPLGWILCPITNLLDGAVGFLDDKIRSMLYVKESYLRNEGLESSWRNIRNVAYIVLIPVMLVMVIGTALGFEVFSAYTIKKALPRMVIAIIFITLSWYICVLLVDFFNVMGAGIRGLILIPFDELNSGLGGQNMPPLKQALSNAGILEGGTGASTVGNNIGLGVMGLLATGAAFATGVLSIGIIMSTLATAALILGGIFLLLVARQMIIIALILIAPLAILAWIFPGNDKLWKLWFGSFTKLLMLFPLIMLLVGVGQIFAQVTGSAYGPDSPITDKLVAIIIIIGAFVMPFFFIPFAFKWAGGVFGNLAGMVNDRERGALDRLRKGREGMRGKHMSNAKNFQRFKGNNALTRTLNTAGAVGTNRPGSWMTPARLNNTRNAAQDMYAAESLKNDKVYQSNQNDDNFLLALGDRRLAEQKLANARTKLSAEQAKAPNLQDATKIAELQAQIDAREGGLANANLIANRSSKGVQMAAVQALAATGYQYESGEAGYDELAGSIRRIVGDDDQSFASAMNSAQYGAKNAGRFDLGGINNGAGYDRESGLSKASLYQLANGKKQSITAMTADFQGVGPLSPKQAESAAVTYSELKAMKSNASGAVADEINKQIEFLESRGIEQHIKNPVLDKSGNPETIDEIQRLDVDRADPSHMRYDAAYAASWSPTEIQAGAKKVKRNKTYGDVADSKARTFQRPDPNNME